MRAWISVLLMALVVVATSGAASRIRATTSGYSQQALAGELQQPAQSGPAPKPKEAKKEFDCAVNSGALSAAGLKIAEQYGK
ncbi:MAG: hypothetical protein JWO59_1501, partial [Chloroflexi bacterium]|nr:hypothetical protein [Chloroflexota bacterium]